MTGRSPTRPEGPTREGLRRGEGTLLLAVPGQPLRAVGRARRLALAAAALWLALVAAGLLAGWVLRGLA